MFLSIKPVNASVIVAVGDNVMAKSIDGGATWNSVTLPIPSGTFWDVCGIDANTLLVVEGSGKVYRSPDAGVNWTLAGSVPTPPLVYVNLASSNTAFASGSNGAILKTNNGGTSWTALNFTSTEVVGVCFVSEQTGYSFEHNGKIRKTTDGGTTWTAQTSGVSTAIRAMAFVDADNGFAVGDNGVILSTTDGGATWTKNTTGTNGLLNSIAITSSFVFVGGFNGLILKSDK